MTSGFQNNSVVVEYYAPARRLGKAIDPYDDKTFLRARVAVTHIRFDRAIVCRYEGRLHAKH
jgi:hypothetical protein